MAPKLVSLALVVIFAGFAAGQTTATKETEDAAKLEKEAVEFLRETSVDVGTLRSMENRISFNAELASLMWFHDDKEARVMYGGVVSDFKQLLAQFDAEMNTAVISPDEDGGGMGGIFGSYGRSKVERKFRIAMAVRQQIAMSLAEHAPDMAYNFFYDSLNLVSNPQFRKETEAADKGFEFQLMKQIAESNAAKAAEYGKESIKGGLEISHIDLLKKIYSKDPDKGVEFGSNILSRLKGDKASVKSMNFYSNLLSFGKTNLEDSKKPGGKKAVYSSGDLRDIAEQFGDAVLEEKRPDYVYMARQFAQQIEPFAPGKAAQIRAKYRESKVYAGNSVNAMPVLETAVGTEYSSNVSVSNRPDPESPYVKAQKAREERDKAQQKLIEDINGLGTKPLPKEERDKVVAQSRKIISQTLGKEQKLTALNLLAAQVAKAGDRELASEIMRDAERLVNPQPKNYQDFLFTWMLATGYADAEPEKAFPLLESTILRANDTIGAFVKVAEFMDTNDEIIADGEVQVGMFGGSMIRDMTNGLGLASGMIKSLAKADFTKTKGLANAFDRTEIRVLAKMMVLRAVLDKGTKPMSFDSMPQDTTEPEPASFGNAPGRY